MESVYKVIPMELLPTEYLPDEYKGPSAGSVDDIVGKGCSYIGWPIYIFAGSGNVITCLILG